MAKKSKKQAGQVAAPAVRVLKVRDGSTGEFVVIKLFDSGEGDGTFKHPGGHPQLVGVRKEAGEAVRLGWVGTERVLEFATPAELWVCDRELRAVVLAGTSARRKEHS